MSLRRACGFVTLALGVAACARPVPLTTTMRAGAEPTKFWVLGRFELQLATPSADRPQAIVVQNRHQAAAVRAKDDSTITIAVDTHPDTLVLLFKLSPADGGVFTLRAVNGHALGETITLNAREYRYASCYLRVDWYCRPVKPETMVDSEVRLGVVP